VDSEYSITVIITVRPKVKQADFVIKFALTAWLPVKSYYIVVSSTK